MQAAPKSPPVANVRLLTVDEILRCHPFGAKATIINRACLQEATIEGTGSFFSFGGQPIVQSMEEHTAKLIIALGQGHPFNDGNKRTTLRATLFFLKKNNWQVVPGKESALINVINLCTEQPAGDVSPVRKPVAAEMLEGLIQPSPQAALSFGKIILGPTDNSGPNNDPGLDSIA